MREWLGAPRSPKRLLDSEAKLQALHDHQPELPRRPPLPVSAKANAPAFGCNGQNQAPTLRWTNEPAGAMGFASTLNDSDSSYSRRLLVALWLHRHEQGQHVHEPQHSEWLPAGDRWLGHVCARDRRASLASHGDAAPAGHAGPPRSWHPIQAAP